jgi:hypothetical protein
LAVYVKADLGLLLNFNSMCTMSILAKGLAAVSSTV